MRLTTERLILRPWLEVDAEDLYEYAKDSRVGPIAGWPVHTSVENSRENIKTVLSADETYAVCLKPSLKAIGSIGLMIGNASNLKLSDTEGEIGYWLGVPFGGQGLIPEAVKEMIRHGFEDLKLEKIWCGYYERNIKSKRVQEKCGFIPHHINKGVKCEFMGDIRNEYINCITRAEWMKSQEENVIIRPMNEKDDKLTISHVYEASWKYAYQGILPQSFLESIPVGNWVSHLENTEMNTLVMLKENKIIGTASYCKSRFLEYKEKGEIVSIYFLPEYIGKGYGKQLLNAVVKELMTLGYKEMFLWVLEENYGARAFYERLGFIQSEAFLEDNVGGKAVREIQYYKRITN